MSNQEQVAWCIWCAIVAALLVILAVTLLPVSVWGQEHTHEGDVGQFYATWRPPNLRGPNGERYSSCCNNQDCRPVQQMRKHPGGTMTVPSWGKASVSAMWEILINVPWSTAPEWIAVPDAVWEDNQGDPRESPDGRVHACVTHSGYVNCAVRASEQ